MSNKQNDRTNGRIAYEQNELAELDLRIPTLKEGSKALAKALGRREKTVALIAKLETQLAARIAKQAEANDNASSDEPVVIVDGVAV